MTRTSAEAARAPASEVDHGTLGTLTMPPIDCATTLGLLVQKIETLRAYTAHSEPATPSEALQRGDLTPDWRHKQNALANPCSVTPHSFLGRCVDWFVSVLSGIAFICEGIRMLDVRTLAFGLAPLGSASQYLRQSTCDYARSEPLDSSCAWKSLVEKLKPNCRLLRLLEDRHGTTLEELSLIDKMLREYPTSTETLTDLIQASDLLEPNGKNADLSRIFESFVVDELRTASSDLRSRVITNTTWCLVSLARETWRERRGRAAFRGVGEIVAFGCLFYLTATSLAQSGPSSLMVLLSALQAVGQCGMFLVDLHSRRFNPLWHPSTGLDMPALLEGLSQENGFEAAGWQALKQQAKENSIVRLLASRYRSNLG